MRIHSLTLALGVAAALVSSACDDAKPTQPAASSATAAQGSPKISAAKSKHDFGKVKQGAEVDHVFKLRNQGATPLLIQKAKGS